MVGALGMHPLPPIDPEPTRAAAVTRRSRSERPVARRYAVTARDREVLFAIGLMAMATTDQIRRLFFGDASTASRRLAKLVALRLLDAHVSLTNAQNIFTLTRKALGLLEANDMDMTLLHQARVGRSIDSHLLMMNELRVQFVLGVRKNPGVDLRSFSADLDLRRQAGSSPPSYVPDAIVDLLLPTGRLVLIVEVDTSTEATSVFAKKVAQTIDLWSAAEACWGAGRGIWRPVAVVPGAGRARALARAIVKQGGGDLWLLAEAQNICTRGIFGSVFAAASEVAAIGRGVPIEYRGALVAPPAGDSSR